MRSSVMRPPAILAISCSLLLGTHLVSSASLGSDGTASPTQYNVGIGIADNTGPAAEIGMMGYAKAGQNTGGIHLRLFSRAFIFEGSPGKRFVFVSIDAGMMDPMVKIKVVKKLQEKYGPDLYTHANVAISGTHTHSGPAGFLQYILFQVSSLGSVQDTVEAFVGGITLAIERAHDNMKLSTLSYAQGEIADANINRSPTSYLANPEEERNQYSHDTDHTMVQLNIFEAEGGKPRGLINWFAVHPTSMNNTNHLISGDNKGKASQMFEKMMNGKDVRTGKGEFVAAFASTNLGDVSPNLKGPHCADTGLPCDLIHSTCNGRTELCWAAGPGEDMFDSTRIIAERQFEMSHSLLESENQTSVSGPVDFIHQWIDMTDQSVDLDDGSQAKTCKPAMGYSFAAGTTDGPGAFDFTQGTNSSNPFWDFVAGLLAPPSEEQKACHAPKPILLDTGDMHIPYDWHPHIIDTQMLRIGQFIIAPLPGEFTTMSGRRMRKTITEAMDGAEKEDSSESADFKVVLAGLSNVYTHYIATFEEYQRQRYEAASTIFGPHSLQAYQQQYSKLAVTMLRGNSIDEGSPPEDLSDHQIELVPGVVFDNPPFGHQFGDCKLQPPSAVAPGDTVTVKFVSGHLRNDMMLEDTFLSIERQINDSAWQWVATDADWETKMHWTRTNVILGESEVTIEWEVPEDTLNGTYRIMHQGYHKDLLGKYFYSGYTNNFQVATGIILDKSDIVEPRQSFLERLVSFFVEPINVFVN